MIYTFYADFYYRKVRQDIEADTWREARNKFFEAHKDTAHKIIAIHCGGNVIWTNRGGLNKSMVVI